MSGGKERISCVLESALPDILFVSYASDSQPGRVYQGALLHRSSNGRPPHIENFSLELKNDNPRDFALESFPTLSRRHTYFERRSSPGQSMAPAKKLGVRLRARQVLCHNCKNVCNEKGENVQAPHPPSAPKNDYSPLKRRRPVRGSNAHSSEPASALTLVPKIRRLDPEEIVKFSGNNEEDEPIKPLIKIKLSGNTNNSRSLEEPGSSTTTTSTPVLKISFGSQQGRGTVMKIPARSRNNNNEEEAEGNEENSGDGPAKAAAKKALKRARKEAYSVILPPSSPSTDHGGRPRNKVIIRRPKHKRKKHKRNKKTTDSLEELYGQTVDSFNMEDGKTMCVGDVVWGKIEEFPWWPGKVTDIFLKPDASGEIQPEAKVTWYDLQNDIISSLLLRAQIKPFKESYQDCFSSSTTVVAQRYKEAVEAASEEIRLKTAAASNHQHPPPHPPPFSPRPIDCQT